MAVTDVVGDIVRATMAFHYPGNKQYQTMNIHYLCSVAGGSDSRFALAQLLDNRIATNLLPTLATTTVAYGTKVATLNRSPNPIPRQTLALAAGLDVLDVLPTQVRGLISCVSDVAGRRGRGRIFTPTPSKSQLDLGGEMVPGYVTVMTNFAHAVYTSLTTLGSTWTAVLASKTKPPTVVWTTHPITGSAGGVLWATQRRGGDRGRQNAAPWTAAG
jgi:hypothetical protein